MLTWFHRVLARWRVPPTRKVLTGAWWQTLPDRTLHSDAVGRCVHCGMLMAGKDSYAVYWFECGECFMRPQQVERERDESMG